MTRLFRVNAEKIEKMQADGGFAPTGQKMGSSPTAGMRKYWPDQAHGHLYGHPFPGKQKEHRGSTVLFLRKEGNYEKQTDECVLTYLIETIISKDPNTEKPPDVPTALLSAFSRSVRG